MTDTDTTDTSDGYDTFGDGPRVQIPLGRDTPGLSIDGEFMAFYELPGGARDAYEEYARQGGQIRIYQCETCGYLTDADALGAGSRATYNCGNCGRSTGSRGGQRSSTGSFRQVHGPYVRPGELNEEGFVDVQGFVAEQNCPDSDAHGPSVEADVDGWGRPDVDDDAADCDKCVPNHPSHLGRLQNAAEGEVTRDEMFSRVADAVAAFREA